MTIPRDRIYTKELQGNENTAQKAFKKQENTNRRHSLEQSLKPTTALCKLPVSQNTREPFKNLSYKLLNRNAARGTNTTKDGLPNYLLALRERYSVEQKGQ